MSRIDIDFSFKRHPLTGDLATKKSSSAIKQSLRNIVLTNYYERGFNVEMASNLDGSLFENVSVLLLQQIKDNIENAVKNFEPNVELIEVEVIDNDDNSMSVTLYYHEYNSPEPQMTTIPLVRLR